MLNFIKAEYDDDDNMKLEIPVYARILNTDASVDSPNRIVYILCIAMTIIFRRCHFKYQKRNRYK